MSRDLHTALTSLAGVCALAACAASQKPDSGKPDGDGGPMVMMVGSARVDIEKPALAFPKTSGRFNGWLGYALMRRIWIDSKFGERFKNEPTYRHTYEEEIESRERAWMLWSKLDAKDHYDDRYFSELGQILNAGFLREYVWYCVPHPEWTKPADLRTEDFSAWMSANLPSHLVETWVSARSTPSGPRVVLGSEAHKPRKCEVTDSTMTPNPSSNPTRSPPAN